MNCPPVLTRHQWKTCVGGHGVKFRLGPVIALGKRQTIDNVITLVARVIYGQCVIYGQATFSKIKSHNQFDDVTNQFCLSRLSQEVQEMIGVNFFHVKIGQ